MELGREYKSNDGRKLMNLDSEIVWVIRIPDARILRIASRSLLLATVLVALLLLGPIVKEFSLSSNSVTVPGFEEDAYLRRYGSTVVALRKTGMANKLADSSSPKRELLQSPTEAKTAALKGLEDVLLEPPRQGFAKSKKNLKIEYLPDLLGGSLEGYKRRVFVTAGLPEENRGAIRWFEKNYPKKGAKFEIHGLLVALENPAVPRTDVSAWLSNHVKDEEYVVMKAEAGVVEEMMEKNTMPLVDELFLQCNNEWWQTGKRKNRGRAYWECLALYGRLRDEGVAVHQWWG